MTPEEKAAAEAAEAASQKAAQDKAAAEAAVKVPYTAEELKALTPTSDIDMDRVPETVRPVIENMTRDYKALAGDYTKKSTELADLKRVPETETYFEDAKMDGVFKDYLKAPSKVLKDINAEIANLEAVIPDDGAEEYRKARRQIAYWTGIKDEFQTKRLEVSDKQRNAELAEARLAAELGQEATVLVEYAKTLGFSERDFKNKPELRASVKKMYIVANPGKGKVIPPNPHQAAAPSGEAGGGMGGDGEKVLEELNPNLSTADRIEAMRRRKAAGG